mmetsp:Transcript_31391/g.56209  ORF Transcript_31391/g.56209 Transcript_31391/m.56209 type:complete len:240 (-) Transcript_31391:86-805(-)
MQRSSWWYRLWRRFNSVATPEHRHSMALPITPTLTASLTDAIGPVRPLLDALLLSTATLVELSLLVSLPGATNQEVHSDTPHAEDNDLIVSAFLALSPVTLPHGPTCLFPGTHTPAFHRSIPKTTTQANYYAADGTPELPTASVEEHPLRSDGGRDAVTWPVDDARQALLDAGDLLIFDTRVFHYGSANVSGEERPLVYFSFQRPQEGRPAVTPIEGFTYHCHSSVRGQYVLRDFGGSA